MQLINIKSDGKQFVKIEGICQNKFYKNPFAKTNPKFKQLLTPLF